jgi:hypothetical protein
VHSVSLFTKTETEKGEQFTAQTTNTTPKKKKSTIPVEDSIKTTRRNDCAAAIKEIRQRVKNGESYAEAASYLKRNSAWNIRLAHLKTATLIRYSKDRNR